MIHDLAALLANTPDGANPGAFVVQRIEGFSNHYVGRDDQGRACVLLRSVDSGFRTPLRLTGLHVQFALQCVVQITGEQESREVLTVISCAAMGHEPERYFMHVMSTLISLVGAQPTLLIVSEAVARIALIFQRVSMPSRANLTGVVGELVVIAVSSEPALAIEGWRVDIDERYDFARGDLRLEVKASTTRRRAHSFSFEQCDVPVDCIGILASIFIERSAGGVSLLSLLAMIGRRLVTAPDAMLRLEQTLASTLGTGLAEGLTFSFDFEMAKSSLAFYTLESVPAIRGDVPLGVTQIRFTSDLGSTDEVAPASIQLRCPPFGAFLPIDVSSA